MKVSRVRGCGGRERIHAAVAIRRHRGATLVIHIVVGHHLVLTACGCKWVGIESTREHSGGVSGVARLRYVTPTLAGMWWREGRLRWRGVGALVWIVVFDTRLIRGNLRARLGPRACRPSRPTRARRRARLILQRKVLRGSSPSGAAMWCRCVTPGCSARARGRVGWVYVVVVILVANVFPFTGRGRARIIVFVVVVLRLGFGLAATVGRHADAGPAGFGVGVGR